MWSRAGAVLQVRHVEYESVPYVVAGQPIKSRVDLCGRQCLDIGGDAVLAAEIQHVLGEPTTATVDRIAARAQANKSMIYSYFGNKEELFDIVFTTRVDSDVDTTPLDADDLPDYAVRLYDMYLADPDLVRLLTWARLERTPTGPLFSHAPARDDEVLACIADAQERGLVVDDIDPPELWSMLIALAATWAQSAIVHTATASEDPVVHERRRTALRTATTRAFCP